MCCTDHKKKRGRPKAHGHNKRFHEPKTSK
uniref:Uncharacterized protein n=1 Tax=Globisporangium ultimum (strain ATCC 200006 / CBS 805.95 / DAOM BR144) TaxID=431595 RepID=K3WDP4_GLOUD